MIWKKNLFVSLLIFLISIMLFKNLYANNPWEKVNLPLVERKLTFGVNSFMGLNDTNNRTDIRFNIFNQINVLSKVENEHKISLEKDQNIDKELKIKLNEAFPSFWIDNYADTVQNNKNASKTHKSNRNNEKIDRGITSNKPSNRFELVLPFAGHFSLNDTMGLDDGLVRGAKLGYLFNFRWAAELEGGYTPTKTTSGNKGNLIQILVNGRYTFKSTRIGQGWIDFYATAGIGAILFRGFGSNDKAMAYQAGGGITYEIKPWLGLRGDWRFIGIGDVTIPGTNTKSGTTKNSQLTAGLVFWF